MRYKEREREREREREINLEKIELWMRLFIYFWQCLKTMV